MLSTPHRDCLITQSTCWVEAPYHYKTNTLVKNQISSGEQLYLRHCEPIIHSIVDVEGGVHSAQVVFRGIRWTIFPQVHHISVVILLKVGTCKLNSSHQWKKTSCTRNSSVIDTNTSWYHQLWLFKPHLLLLQLDI